MKNVKHILLIVAVAALTVFVGCKDDEPSTPDENPKQDAIDALLAGGWTINEGSSTVGAGVTTADVTISLSAGSDVAFSLSGGDIQSYVDGGSITVSETGGLSVASLNVVGTDLEQSGTASITMTASSLTINFEIAESTAARASGTGTYNLVFTAN